MHRTLLNKQLVRALVCGWRPDSLTLRHVKLLWLVTACWVHEPAHRLPFAQIVVLLDKGRGGAAALPLDRSLGTTSDDGTLAALGSTRFSPFNLIDRITVPPMAPKSAYSHPVPSTSGSISPAVSYELSSDSLMLGISPCRSAGVAVRSTQVHREEN